MKNAIISLTVIGVLIIGIFGIYKLLNPEEVIIDNDEEPTTILESELGYDMVLDNDLFDSYLINKTDINDMEISIADLSIKVSDYNLYIEDELVVSNIIINRSFAIYDDKLLVIGVDYNDLLYSGLVFYDIYEKEFIVQDKLNSMYFDSNYTFMDNGILFDIKLVEGSYFIKDDKLEDLCALKLNPDMAIKLSIMYIYDINEKKFVDYEEVSSLTLDSYLAINKLCS